MAHDVVFSLEAQADLIELYEFVAPRGGADRALAYVERIQATCVSLGRFPDRGTRRDDIRRGLRVIGFERRVTIAFHIISGQVVIDRILYAGRDLQGALSQP